MGPKDIFDRLSSRAAANAARMGVYRRSNRRRHFFRTTGTGHHTTNRSDRTYRVVRLIPELDHRIEGRDLGAGGPVDLLIEIPVGVDIGVVRETPCIVQSVP